MEKIIWTTDDLEHAEQEVDRLTQQIGQLRKQFYSEKHTDYNGDEHQETYPETREIEVLLNLRRSIEYRIQDAEVLQSGSPEAKKYGLGDVFKMTDEFGTVHYHIRGSYCANNSEAEYSGHEEVSCGSLLHKWYLEELHRQNLKPGHGQVIEISPITPNGRLRLA